MPSEHSDDRCGSIGVFVHLIDSYESCDWASDFDRRDEAAIVDSCGTRRNCEDAQNESQDMHWSFELQYIP